MSTESSEAHIKQAIPFLGVRRMEKALAFYVDQLGFQIAQKWVVNERIRWCQLELDDVAIMLQEFQHNGEGIREPEEQPGAGMEICFICYDAIAFYHQVKLRGLDLSRPFVGNSMWVVNLTDPDGYRLCFESPTDIAEGSLYED